MENNGETSGFVQDGSSEVRFTFPTETVFLSDKIYETVVFRMLDIKQQRTVIPERK